MYRMIKDGAKFGEIEAIYGCSYRLYDNIWKFIIDEAREANRPFIQPEHKMPYWETEDEMLIPDYKVSDLKGEELEIFSKLANVN
jgi:hypothetical protein